MVTKIVNSHRCLEPVLTKKGIQGYWSEILPLIQFLIRRHTHFLASGHRNGRL